MNVCHILREDPELAEAIRPADRARAVNECIARTARLPAGRWSPGGNGEMQDGIGLLVLEGLLIRRVGIEDRFGAELLGEGDLIRPWHSEDGASTMSRTTGWRVLQPTRVAVLDAQVERRFAAFPPITGRLVGRALGRARGLAVNMAIVHQARVNVRLHMLFWHLADRWGRVGVGGVMLPLQLTHSVLADLVAARRPTVTSSLSELARLGLVQSTEDGWRLSGEPPGELLEIQSLSLPPSSGS